MALTLQEIQDSIRRRLGWPTTDAFVTDAELRGYIKDSQEELYDLLLSVHQDNWNVQAYTFTTVADQRFYSLTATQLSTGVHRVRRISTKFDDISVPMRRFDLETDVIDFASYTWDYGTDLSYRLHWQPYDRNNSVTLRVEFDPTPSNVKQVSLFYNPAPPTLSVSTAVNQIGYDEYIILDGMLKCLQMEESDTTVVERQKARFRERIENLATPIDEGNANVVQDVRGVDDWFYRGYYRYGRRT